MVKIRANTRKAIGLEIDAAVHAEMKAAAAKAGVTLWEAYESACREFLEKRRA